MIRRAIIEDANRIAEIHVLDGGVHIVVLFPTNIYLEKHQFGKELQHLRILSN